jgi:hypothetical protein
MNWKREWFRITDKKFPQNHFQNFKNQLTFFDTLAQQYNLQDPSDWKMISLNLIKKRGGGVCFKYKY